MQRCACENTLKSLVLKVSKSHFYEISMKGSFKLPDAKCVNFQPNISQKKSITP